jgi:hypothetical protein
MEDSTTCQLTLVAAHLPWHHLAVLAVAVLLGLAQLAFPTPSPSLPHPHAPSPPHAPSSAPRRPPVQAAGALNSALPHLLQQLLLELRLGTGGQVVSEMTGFSTTQPEHAATSGRSECWR